MLLALGGSIIILAVWGSIVAIKVFIALSIASARKYRAKRTLVREMRRGGLPVSLARQIGDDYAPSTREILASLKKFLQVGSRLGGRPTT